MKKHIIALCIILISAAAPAVIRANDDKKLDAGKAVVADPALVPRGNKKLEIPRNATIEEQIAILVREIEALRAAAARVTLIITAELERAPEEERGGAVISISGGKLEREISCNSSRQGMCVFILAPIEEADPAYRIKIRKKRFADTTREIRLDPGAVVVLPIRVELTPAERERVINPTK